MFGWLTPDAGTGAAICRPLTVPLEYLPAVNGALQQLLDTWNWEEHGNQTPDQAVATMQAMLDAFYTENCGMTQVYPEVINLWWRDATVLHGNPLLLTVTANQIDNHYYAQSAPGALDQCKMTVLLGAGTYKLVAIGGTSATGGLQTVKMDGATIGTLNWNGAVVWNVERTLTNIVIADDGLHTLDFIMPSSGSDFQARITRITLIKTGS